MNIKPRRQKISGVYKIICTPTEKLYVGSSKDIHARWLAHRGNLRNNLHPNIHLQRAWNKYGEKAFTYEVLGTCERIKEVLESLEQTWMDALSPEFNIREKASSNLGCKSSEETKENKRQAQLERWAKIKRTNDVCGHLDKEHYGKGMCQFCWRKEKTEQAKKEKYLYGYPANLIGHTFNYWAVVSEAEYKDKKHYWNCVCTCGATSVVTTDYLLKGKSLSCGCIRGGLYGHNYEKQLSISKKYF